MKYLFSFYTKLKPIMGAKRIILLLDYDGTLTPIVRRPGRAKLSESMRDLLRGLSKHERYTVGIISGRLLKDLKGKVRLKGIYYSGNHGLEIQGPQYHHIRLTYPEALKRKPLMAIISRELNRNLGGIKGIIVEDKGLTLSLHYRMARPRDIPQVKKIFNQIVRPYLRKGKIKITSGKKVFEVRPPITWNKGKAVMWLLRSIPSKKILPIYIGDDWTDEDAFAVLKGSGITILVGERSSQASYFVRNVPEVQRFLRMLLQNKEKIGVE